MLECLSHKIRFDSSDEGDQDKIHDLLRESTYHRINHFVRALSIQRISNPSLADFLALINLDSYIRTSISRLTPNIEVYVKTALTHVVLNRKWNSDVYLEESLYKHRSKRDKEKLEESLYTCIESVLKSRKNDESVQHYYQNHGGHIPVWEFYDVLTFGEFNMLVSRLEKSVLRDLFEYMISKRPNKTNDLVISSQPKSLPSFLQTVQLLRNATAHNSIIYGKTFVYNPSIKLDNAYWKKYKRLDFEINNETTNRQIHSLFTGLVIMRYFYASMSDKRIRQWDNFVRDLKKHIDGTPLASISGFLGFPDNWFELLNIL